MSKLKKLILGIFAILGTAKTVQEIWSAFKEQIIAICTVIIMFMTVIFSYISTAVEYWGYNLIILSLLLIGYLWFAFLNCIDRYKLAKQRRKNQEECNKYQIEADFAKEQEITRFISTTPLQNPDQQAVFSAKMMMFAALMPKAKKDLIENVAKIKIGENATQSQKSSIYTLLGEFDPFSEKVNLLIPKILEAIKNNSISKQSVKFLSSITDDDLDILKKQFKYVLKLPHKDDKSDVSSQDLAIWFFENDNTRIQNLLIGEKGLFLLESYHIKFYGDVWLGESDRASFYVLKDDLDIIDNIDSKGLFKIQIAVRKKEEPKKGQLVTSHSPLTGSEDKMSKSKVIFPAYVCLGEIGMEIFNLLKNELEPTPEKYMNGLIEHWGKNNPQFDFKLISEQKLITNDDT